jgi:long-chain-fatty-acid--[acyl-carrier-protein] ligase
MVSLASIEDALTKSSAKYKWPEVEEGPTLAVCAHELAGEKTKFYLFSAFTVDVDEVNRALRESGFSNLVRITAVKQLKEIPIMGTGKVHYRMLENEELPQLIKIR